MLPTSPSRILLVAALGLAVIAPGAIAGPIIPAAPSPTKPPTIPLPAVHAPEMQSAAGLTVTSTSDVTERTFDVKMDSANIDPRATVNGLGVRITLPTDYATSGKRYPVIYLLHGAGASHYNFWHAVSRGTIEEEAADKAIIVMPDGGKNGWYTNWIQGYKQNWHTFHNDQLVPFIDANLRTIANRDGRAIAGLSMGGFGAMRYAGDRPDLYSTVASFSGALNQQLPQFTGVVLLASQQYGMAPFGAFGSPMWPFNGAWVKANPTANPNRFKAVKPFIFVGAKNDVAEMAVRQGTYEFVNALKKAKVPHYFENIGLGGPTTGDGPDCTGGHETACAPYIVPKAFPMILNELTPAS